MDNLNLDINDLEVQSFTTSSDDKKRGTVQGNLCNTDYCAGTADYNCGFDTECPCFRDSAEEGTCNQYTCAGQYPCGGNDSGTCMSARCGGSDNCGTNGTYGDTFLASCCGG